MNDGFRNVARPGQVDSNRTWERARIVQADQDGWRARVIGLNNGVSVDTGVIRRRVRPAFPSLQLSPGLEVWIVEYFGRWYAWHLFDASSLGLTQCGCMDCIDHGSITDCAAASPAPRTFFAGFAAWEELPSLEGRKKFEHVGDCSWETATFVGENGGTPPTTSEYKLRLTFSADRATVTLVHVSGPNNASPLEYRSTAAFDPLCKIRLQIHRPGMLRSRTGLNCELCLAPGTACEDYGPFPAAFRVAIAYHACDQEQFNLTPGGFEIFATYNGTPPPASDENTCRAMTLQIPGLTGGGCPWYGFTTPAYIQTTPSPDFADACGVAYVHYYALDNRFTFQLSHYEATAIEGQQLLATGSFTDPWERHEIDLQDSLLFFGSQLIPVTGSLCGTIVVEPA